MPARRAEPARRSRPGLQLDEWVDELEHGTLVVIDGKRSDPPKVSKDTDRDLIMTADQAVEYGAVDEIITSRKIRPELVAAAAGGS